MGLEHSWKWLPPRFKAERVKGQGRTRACLPALEPLDDRLLLSAATGDPGIIAVLIGLLRNEINVRNGELDAMKIAAGGVDVTDKQFKDDAAFVNLQGEFWKLDVVLDKASTDAVHGGLSDKKVLEATKKVDAIFTDIAKLLPFLGGKGEGEGSLLPAVQKVREAALGALDKAGQVNKITLDGTALAKFIKVENDLVKIDNDLLRFTVADMKWGLDNKVTVEAKFHLAASFDKLNTDIKQMGDGSVFKGLTDDLASMKLHTLSFMASVPKGIGTTPTVAFLGLSLDAMGDVVIG